MTSNVKSSSSTKQNTQALQSARKSILDELLRHHEAKKVLSFLGKCAVLAIDHEQHQFTIGTPNAFVLSQVKKFFHKALQQATQTIYQSTFTIHYDIEASLQTSHPLHAKQPAKKTKTDTKKIAKAENHFHRELSNYFGILFDSNFTFHNLISGANNELAVAAAHAVATNPGQTYNPLFIYGNVGLGKTHLMQAIGNHIIQHGSNRVVVYLPTTKLIDEIVKGIRKNKLSHLMAKLNQVDVLLLDDIQFLAQKEKTQEIFHNIFNEFHAKKKQIVMTADRPPKELNNIAQRLTSRFSLGLVTDIQAPDFETRVAILASKAEQKQCAIDTALLEIVATHITSNVRELEGAINLVTTKKKLTSRELTHTDIITCLNTLGYKVTNETEPDHSSMPGETYYTKTLSFNDMVHKVAHYYQLTTEAIKSDSRKKEISLARQLLMLIAKQEFDRTLERIGDYFGGKNHTTVIYAIKNIQKKLQADSFLSRDYQRIMQK